MSNNNTHTIYTQLLESSLVGDNLDITYKEVKDFKWHRQQASPNWGLLHDLMIDPASRGCLEGSGRDANYYKTKVQLWQPPVDAFKVGFTNSLLPMDLPDAPSTDKTTHSGGGDSNQATEDGGDDSEDEL